MGHTGAFVGAILFCRIENNPAGTSLVLVAEPLTPRAAF